MNQQSPNSPAKKTDQCASSSSDLIDDSGLNSSGLIGEAGMAAEDRCCGRGCCERGRLQHRLQSKPHPSISKALDWLAKDKE